MAALSLKIFVLLAVVNLRHVLTQTQCPSKGNIADLKDIQLAIICSQNVYKHKTHVGSYIPGTNFKIKMVHKPWRAEDEFKVYVAEHDDVTIVAFRGTISTGQLLRQFLHHFKHIEGKRYKIAGVCMKINAFFLDAFHVLFDELKPYLRDGRRKYILTGHSLGGALASILALKMTQEYRGSIWNHPQSSLITFGQPRVGNQKYADLHDKLISPWRKYRFVLHKDPVPKIPFYDMFVHHSREIFVSSSGLWRVCKEQEDVKCSHGYNIELDTLIVDVSYHKSSEYRHAAFHPPTKYINTHNKKETSFKKAILSSCR